ncbi:class II fructose-bisphosphatase [Virgibacillus ihumii]|uniref:class II fructose-bisphosphatase n=1 Tax=Virgibacillus ihumii TaxID=2686091 RepID=UPI00157D8945|nr:class II fructose-bisphosphatase [Virgibacillus ihumii]
MESLVLDFLNVTESAALAAKRWVGRGDKHAADEIATKVMREQLNGLNMKGRIVIGEGEIDDAPMLHIGEAVGNGVGPELDIAVDPIEGTTPTANGQNNAMTVIAVAPKGSLLHAPDMYMEKLAVGSKAKGKINIDAPISENLEAVAEAKGKKVHELNILVQDRPRHQDYIDTIRQSGAKVHLFKDGDVIYTISTCMNRLDMDLFLGIGGAPEGVLGAVAVKSLGGEMQAKLRPRNDVEMERCKSMGLEIPEMTLKHNDLVKSENCFLVATGITNCFYLKGITSDNTTHSILIGGKGQQMRYVETQHSVKEVYATR